MSVPADVVAKPPETPTLTDAASDPTSDDTAELPNAAEYEPGTDNAPAALFADVPARVNDIDAASAPTLVAVDPPSAPLVIPTEANAPDIAVLCTPTIALLTEGVVAPADVVVWFAPRAAEYDTGSARVPTDVVADVPPRVIDSVAASTPVAVADATPEIEAVAATDGESVPTDDVAATPAIPFDTPVVVVPATVETWLPVTALDTAGDNMPAAAVLAVPDMVAVAPADGDSEPAADATTTPDIEVEILGTAAPVLDVP